MTTSRQAFISQCVFFAAALLVSVLSPAQGLLEYGPFRFQRYTENDGLVSSETTDTYKDRQGFLWVATFQGLSRFDGRNFENFGRQNGLTESNVDLLGEDAAGQIFIKSVSNIYQYTGAQGNAFFKYPSNGRFIGTACPDGKDQVWVAYDGEPGLHLLTPQGEIKKLETATPVLKLVRANRDELYVLEFNGRLSLLKDDRLTPVYSIQPRQPFTNEGIRMFRDTRGTVWTYGANNDFLYAHQGARLADSIRVPQNTHWWEWWIGNGNVYSASDTGSVVQLIDGRWQAIFDRAQTRGSIYELKEDGNGILWITTSSGLLKITRKPYKNVRAGSADWYYAADRNGRYILRSDSLLYSIPDAVKYLYRLQPETVTHVYVTKKKDVWYCTEKATYVLPYGKGLQKLNTSNTYEGQKAAFRFRRVLEDGEGGVFISSYHGIFHKQGDSLHYYWAKEGLTEGAIYTIAIDRNRIFYAAGIHVYALQNGRFTDVSRQLKLPDEISRLVTDQQGALWIVQEGVDVIRKIAFDNGNFRVADSLPLLINGMPFAAISASFDSDNNLWLGDNRSLYCFVKKGSAYAPSPLFFDEDLSGSPLVYTDDSGQLQVLSHPLAGNYLRTYSARQLLQGYHHQPPTIYLSGISLFKDAFDWKRAGFSTDALGVPQDLNLKYNQNFLRFGFIGLTANYDRNIAYRYRLNGYDHDWSPATGKSEAEYTGLPPGNYTFEAQARSAGGEWSKPLHYSFRIGQVWYLRLWARLLWLSLFLLLSGGLIYYRFQSLKRREKVKQMIVEEQLKALRAQINPHFLQNTFAFLAHEFYTAHNTKAVKAIDRLSVYLKDVLRYSDKAAITLEEELEFAEEYLQMQQQLLHTPFTYNFHVPDDIDTFDVIVPSMLLQPIIENAIKYGVDDGGSISIHVSSQYPYLRCVISDTGGRLPASNPLPQGGNGKGIALTKDRMKLFFSSKRNKPQFYWSKNDIGGSDVILLIPID